MKTGSTRKEAEKHLKNGAVIYEMSEKDDFIKYGGFFSHEDAVETWEALEYAKYDGKEYKVLFVL